MFFIATPGEYMVPFEDLVKGNPSIEMMKQVVVTAKKRPEFPAAFNVETVSVYIPSLQSNVFNECIYLVKHM